VARPACHDTFSDPGATSCLILDVAMPGMSGPQLQRELVRGGHAIPTIFITAQADETARQRLLSEGAIECLFRPFTGQQLCAALAAAFKSN
jgi:FixJ family two-component response regulator